VNWGSPVHYISNLFEMNLRKLHARPEEGKGRNRFSDDGLSLNVSRDIWKDVS
jgi:hypothetical protein